MRLYNIQFCEKIACLVCFSVSSNGKFQIEKQCWFNKRDFEAIESDWFRTTELPQWNQKWEKKAQARNRTSILYIFDSSNVKAAWISQKIHVSKWMYQWTDLNLLISSLWYIFDCPEAGILTLPQLLFLRTFNQNLISSPF